MFKWILIIFLIYFLIWIFFAYNSENKKISEQMDVKTMTFSNPSYITETFSVCKWTCKNYSSSSSSSSSWGWWWSSWK